MALARVPAPVHRSSQLQPASQVRLCWEAVVLLLALSESPYLEPALVLALAWALAPLSGVQSWISASRLLEQMVASPRSPARSFLQPGHPEPPIVRS